MSGRNPTSEEIVKLLTEIRSEQLVRDFEIRWAPNARREPKPATFALQDRIVALVMRTIGKDDSQFPSPPPIDEGRKG